MLIGEKDLGKDIKKQGMDGNIGANHEDSGFSVPEQCLLQARHEFKRGLYTRGLHCAEQSLAILLEMEDKTPAAVIRIDQLENMSRLMIGDCRRKLGKYNVLLF